MAEFNGAERECKRCGAKLVFLLGPGDVVMPLSRINAVYVRNTDQAGEPLVLKDRRGGQSYVSHYETCPDWPLKRNAETEDGGR